VLALTGYTFAGWCSTDNATDPTGCTGTSYSAADTFTMPASNVTLYAQWTADTYTVTYSGNGSTGGTAPVDPSSPYDAGATVTVLGNTGSLVKTGYTFDDWNTAAAGTGTSYAASGSVTFSMPAADVVLYAIWTENTPSPPTTTPFPTQIFGIDAIGTSIAVSEAEFPTAGSAKALVLARDDFFSDALAGGPLAAAVDGPILITEGASISSSLDPRVQAEILRVLPRGGTVYILGGDLALSPNIDATLEGLGYIVVREAGINEYATAVDIAEAIATTSWGTPSTIFEATGLYFYDALSAVPAAIKEHAAILLTDGPTQAPETTAYLAEHPRDTRYAVGGTQAAAGADPTAIAVYGADLFSTSAAVAATFFPNPSIFGVATSSDFQDALGGGVFMATGGRMGPLLIVNQSLPLPPEIVPYLASLALGTQAYVFGGIDAISAAVVAAIQTASG
jgi:uncharacterized repeat protein (TIGR02543 family)